MAMDDSSLWSTPLYLKETIKGDWEDSRMYDPHFFCWSTELGGG